MSTEINDRFYQGRTVLTEAQEEAIETALSNYEIHGAHRWFESDVIEILTDLLPWSSAYKNVEVKS